MGIFGKAFHLFYAFSFLEIDPRKKALIKGEVSGKAVEYKP
jgi:hypothetical protein